MPRDVSISPSITDLTNDQLTKHQNECLAANNDLPSKSGLQLKKTETEYNPGSSTVIEGSIHANESEGSHQRNCGNPKDPKNVEIPEIPVTGYPPQEYCTEYDQQTNISGSFQQSGQKPVRPHNVSRFKQPDSKRNELDTRQIFTDL